MGDRGGTWPTSSSVVGGQGSLGVGAVVTEDDSAGRLAGRAVVAFSLAIPLAGLAIGTSAYELSRLVLWLLGLLFAGGDSAGP